MEKPETQISAEEGSVVAVVSSQELSAEISTQVTQELAVLKNLKFDPKQDVSQLDLSINVAINKITALSEMDIKTMMEEAFATEILIESDRTESEKDFTDEEDDDEIHEQTLTPAKIIPRKPSVMEILTAEQKLASTIATYSKIVSDGLKQKRMLTGQLYGPRTNQSNQVTRMLQVKGKNMKLPSTADILNQLSNNSVTMNPNRVVAHVTNGQDK